MTPFEPHREPIRIDAAHPALAGHFPGNPVVPGVVLLDRVLDAAQRHLGLRVDTLRLPQVKFLQPLLPDQSAEIVLDMTGPDKIEFEKIGLEQANLSSAPDQRIRFRIERDGALLASGELVSSPSGAATASIAVGTP